MLRLVVLLLPLAVRAQEGCGELEGLVQQLQKENAELMQQAMGHEKAAQQAMQDADGLTQKLSVLETAKTSAEQQAASQEQEKREALDALETLRQQIGGHEAAKVETLQAMEGLQQELASHKEAKIEAAKAVEDLRRQAALQEETAKHLTATCQASEETPYLSTDIFYKVLGILSDVTSVGYDSIKEQYPDWDAQLTSVAWAVTNVSMEQVQAAAVGPVEVLRSQVAELSSALAAQALDAADKAKATTLDLHKTHVEPHVGVHLAEAQKQGEELYASHVEPHIGTAREIYAKSVHPHVDAARSALKSGLSVATEQVTAGVAVLSEMVRGGLSSKLSAWVADSRLKGLEEMELLTSKTLKIGGRVLRFPRGLLDIVAALIQLTLVSFVLFVVAWRLCLKTLLWRLGVKVFGKQAICVSIRSLSICRRSVVALVQLTLHFLSWSLGAASMVTCLGVMSAVGACFVYGAELSLLLGLGVSKGLDFPTRVAAGLAIGLLWGLVVGPSMLCGCCGLCMRRKAKAKKVETNVAKAKAKATSTPQPDAKANAKAAAKVDGAKKK